MKSYRNDGGYAILMVMCFALILGSLLAAAYNYSSTEIRIAARQGDIEDALYVAQGAVEQAAACWAKKGKAPWSTNGVIGRGTFVVAIVPAAMPNDAPRTISGWVDVDATGRPDNFLLVEQQNGSTIVGATLLVTGYTGYNGPASYIRLRTGGTGSQATLQLDASAYTFNNNDTYDIFSPAMSVNIYKDTDNKWKMSIATSCASFIVSD